MNKHVIYVPKIFAPKARDLAIEYAGGVTLSGACTGYWKDSLGRVVSDDIVIVTVFEEGRMALAAILTHLYDLGEESVAYEKNGVPRILDYGTIVDFALL